MGPLPDLRCLKSYQNLLAVLPQRHQAVHEPTWVKAIYHLSEKKSMMIMIWYLASLLTLPTSKSYRDDGKMIMNRSAMKCCKVMSQLLPPVGLELGILGSWDPQLGTLATLPPRHF